MAAAKKKRISKASVREHNKRDNSPNWTGCESWTAEQFNSYYHDSMAYYRIDYSKDLKPKVIDWMGHNGYDRDTIQKFKKTKDWRCSLAVGAVAANLLKGMPEVRADFNGGKNTGLWLRNQISEIIEKGTNDAYADPDEIDSTAPVVPVLNIQDRIREQAGTMCDEIDGAIDNFIVDADTFDPKVINFASVLRSKGAKGPQARYIKGFYQGSYEDLGKVANGEADQDLKEGYKHLSKKNARKIVEFYENLMTACNQIIAEAKVLKKPRKKKFKSAEDQVRKIKFKLSDDKLGIASVPPAQIVGAQSVVVYNTKNRKIGYYIANSVAGLLVKGTSITEFSKKSVQKTLRKPLEQLKEFKDQNTKNRMETWFSKIKTTEIELNGRLNQDIVILKVFK
jgi:hypothetical protein